MQTNEIKSWEELYVAAVLETDPARIADRLDTAQDALRERWHALRQLPLARDPEKQRVEDAIQHVMAARLVEAHGLVRAPVDDHDRRGRVDVDHAFALANLHVDVIGPRYVKEYLRVATVAAPAT